MRAMRSWTVRGLFAVALLIAALAIWSLAVSPSKAAIVAGPGVTVYYSSATYKTVVGAKGTGCCGAVINWGITTKWKKFEMIYCPDVVCPQDI